MIPWTSFIGRETCYTDLQFPLHESILLSHAGPPSDLRQEYEASPMLENASERRFALSQLDHSHYDFATRHLEDVETALNQLSTHFEKNRLFMPSPRVPSSPCKSDLVGLTGRVLSITDIPEFDLEGALVDSQEANLPSPKWSSQSSEPARAPGPFSNSSSRLSISSLVHQESTTAGSTILARATTPITIDSAPSPLAPDESHVDPSKSRLDSQSQTVDFNALFNESDEHLMSALSNLVHSRSLYSRAIPLSHPTRTRKPPRMRRSSRSRSRHDQSEEIRKAMKAEEESRRRDMEKIGETWREMKQKEEEERERLKAEDDARAFLDIQEDVDGDDHGDEVNDQARASKKRRKLDDAQRSKHQRLLHQTEHVTYNSPTLFERGGREAVFGWEKYGKYDRGPS